MSESVLASGFEVSPYAMELRAEELEVLCAGELRRRGEADSATVGGSVSDTVAGLEEVRVGGDYAHAVHGGSMSRMKGFRTSVHGGLRLEGHSHTTLLAGGMSEAYLRDQLVVSGMSDDMIGGAGCRYATLQVAVAGLMHEDQQLGTSVHDGALVELARWTYEREFILGRHTASSASFSGQAYTTRASSLWKFYKVCRGLRNRVRAAAAEESGGNQSNTPGTSAAEQAAGATGMAGNAGRGARRMDDGGDVYDAVRAADAAGDATDASRAVDGVDGVDGAQDASQASRAAGNASDAEDVENARSTADVAEETASNAPELEQTRAHHSSEALEQLREAEDQQSLAGVAELFDEDLYASLRPDAPAGPGVDDGTSWVRAPDGSLVPDGSRDPFGGLVPDEHGVTSQYSQAGRETVVVESAYSQAGRPDGLHYADLDEVGLVSYPSKYDNGWWDMHNPGDDVQYAELAHGRSNGVYDELPVSAASLEEFNATLSPADVPPPLPPPNRGFKADAGTGAFKADTDVGPRLEMMLQQTSSGGTGLDRVAQLEDAHPYSFAALDDSDKALLASALDEMAMGRSASDPSQTPNVQRVTDLVNENASSPFYDAIAPFDARQRYDFQMQGYDAEEMKRFNQLRQDALTETAQMRQQHILSEQGQDNAAIAQRVEEVLQSTWNPHSTAFDTAGDPKMHARQVALNDMWDELSDADKATILHAQYDVEVIGRTGPLEHDSPYIQRLDARMQESPAVNAYITELETQKAEIITELELQNADIEYRDRMASLQAQIDQAEMDAADEWAAAGLRSTTDATDIDGLQQQAVSQTDSVGTLPGTTPGQGGADELSPYASVDILRTDAAPLDGLQQRALSEAAALDDAPGYAAVTQAQRGVGDGLPLSGDVDDLAAALDDVPQAGDGLARTDAVDVADVPSAALRDGQPPAFADAPASATGESEYATIKDPMPQWRASPDTAAADVSPYAEVSLPSQASDGAKSTSDRSLQYATVNFRSDSPAGSEYSRIMDPETASITSADMFEQSPLGRNLRGESPGAWSDASDPRRSPAGWSTPPPTEPAPAPPAPARTVGWQINDGENGYASTVVIPKDDFLKRSAESDDFELVYNVPLKEVLDPNPTGNGVYLDAAQEQRKRDGRRGKMLHEHLNVGRDQREANWLGIHGPMKGRYVDDGASAAPSPMMMGSDVPALDGDGVVQLDAFSSENFNNNATLYTFASQPDGPDLYVGEFHKSDFYLADDGTWKLKPEAKRWGRSKYEGDVIVKLTEYEDLDADELAGIIDGVSERQSWSVEPHQSPDAPPPVPEWAEHPNYKDVDVLYDEIGNYQGHDGSLPGPGLEQLSESQQSYIDLHRHYQDTSSGYATIPDATPVSVDEAGYADPMRLTGPQQQARQPRFPSPDTAAPSPPPPVSFDEGTSAYAVTDLQFRELPGAHPEDIDLDRMDRLGMEPGDFARTTAEPVEPEGGWGNRWAEFDAPAGTEDAPSEGSRHRRRNPLLDEYRRRLRADADAGLVTDPEELRLAYWPDAPPGAYDTVQDARPRFDASSGYADPINVGAQPQGSPLGGGPPATPGTVSVDEAGYADPVRLVGPQQQARQPRSPSPDTAAPSPPPPVSFDEGTSAHKGSSRAQLEELRRRLRADADAGLVTDPEELRLAYWPDAPPGATGLDDMSPYAEVVLPPSAFEPPATPPRNQTFVLASGDVDLDDPEQVQHAIKSARDFRDWQRRQGQGVDVDVLALAEEQDDILSASDALGQTLSAPYGTNDPNQVRDANGRILEAVETSSEFNTADDLIAAEEPRWGRGELRRPDEEFDTRLIGEPILPRDDILDATGRPVPAALDEDGGNPLAGDLMTQRELEYYEAYRASFQEMADPEAGILAPEMAWDGNDTGIVVNEFFDVQEYRREAVTYYHKPFDLSLSPEVPGTADWNTSGGVPIEPPDWGEADDAW